MDETLPGERFGKGRAERNAQEVSELANRQ
jgi:hypothetical protein